MRSNTNHLSVGWFGANPSQWFGAVNPLPPDMELGSATVTFVGVNAGSEIRIYSTAGVELAGVETCSADHVLTWNVFAPAYNAARIVIIHPDYKIKEFTYAAATGDQSLPIQQERDKWYSNLV